MRKLLLIIFIATITFSGCTKDGGSACGTYNGHALKKGPEGGCFYINKNGNKTYVDRLHCSCK